MKDKYSCFLKIVSTFKNFEFLTKIIVLSGLIIFSIIINASHVLAQDFKIDKFHSDIVIKQDSSINVTEYISVIFSTYKHGIYREIPYKYNDEKIGTIITPISILSVTDGNGNKVKYNISRKGNVVNIRIGDPKSHVYGQQTYILSYIVENAILFFDDHDELYWNVTGNYWWAPIREASANINLITTKQSQNLWAACYTGAAGSKETACRFEISNNNGNFITVRNLGIREGFTIAFGWDKGLVFQPTKWKRILWTLNLKENWVFVMPLFSLIIMINLWRRKGKDPEVRNSITVMYEPPKYNNNYISPAEVGTMIDEKLDHRDITSTIVGLAVKGYIQIEEIKKEGLIFDSTDYYLKRIKESDKNLSAFEKMLMDKIFTSDLPVPGRMISEMKNEFYKHLNTLKKTLYEELISKKYFLTSPDKIRQTYTISGFAIMIIFSFIFPLVSNSPLGFIAGLLTGIPVILFAKAMPVKTKTGAVVYKEILGFREFLSRAEKDRLIRMGDKNLFSKYLPYAIALDVVDNWARAFEGIYQEAPSWYISHTTTGTFRLNSFSKSISLATSSMASAMFSAPRGSGVSSGGGFSGGSSGGGFGGGGGGSW